MNFGILRAPRTLLFGEGSIAAVPGIALEYGSRALLVADPVVLGTPEGLALRADLEAVMSAVSVHAEVVPELPVDAINAVLPAVRDFTPDVVVALGGGSALDLAKVLALLVTNPGVVADYYEAGSIGRRPVPVVAVPSTAGTGSEVTPVAVVTDSARGLKVGLSDPVLVPAAAVVDPLLTLGVPVRATAAAGADALAHAVEAHTARLERVDWSALPTGAIGANAFSSDFALQAVKHLGSSLFRSVEHGGDVAARTSTARGSLAAGLAFATAGVHLGHALQYPIGALTHTPHGVGTGLLLPYVMAAVLEVRTAELADVGRALGVAAEVSAESAAELAIRRVHELMRQIGLPASLTELGVASSELEGIVTAAARISRLVDNAPLAADRVQDALLGIVEDAHAGVVPI
ncbi:iron-containing alcohol dehydrogenase [Herbiconiux sp. YIM B11900]|uniref:iron-containing alcohol dehydrogenase n=1 Tax=Herbiconiux sp. YIM B11900 TaxID=3404131 RepID=UPI003F83B9B0